MDKLNRDTASMLGREVCPVSGSKVTEVTSLAQISLSTPTIILIKNKPLLLKLKEFYSVSTLENLRIKDGFKDFK